MSVGPCAGASGSHHAGSWAAGLTPCVAPASERKADEFIGSHSVEPGLRLPAYLFVHLYTCSDTINISYTLIIAIMYIGFLLGPNTHMRALAYALQGPVV